MKKYRASGTAGSVFSYILFLLMSAFFSFFYQQTFFYVLFFLQLLLLPVSYYLTKWCFAKLSPSLSLIPVNAQKDSSTRLTLKMDNPTRLPVSSCHAVLSFCSGFYGETKLNTHVFPLRANHDNALVFPVVLTKCGLYEASLLRFEVYDFLHLFHFQKECDIKAQVRVFPVSEISQTPHEALYTEGFDEFEESEKKGNVSSNVTDVREYRPGDRLQKIHWKLSSKIDKLMVKENEATSTNQFFMLLELYQPSREDCAADPALNAILDTALEQAQSLALELIEAQEIFIFAFYSVGKEDFVMSTIRCQDDFTEALSECFYEKAYDTENLALDIYERSGLSKGTLLHITHKGVDDVIA